jgi:RND family efflux transporter MFP subunit
MIRNEKMDNLNIGPKASPKRRRWWFAALALVAIAIAGGVAANWKTEAPKAPATERVFEFAPTDLFTVEQRELRRVTPISGALQPIGQATVKAKVAGEVMAVAALEGESVNAGQVLVRLDQTDAKSRLDAQQAALDDARAKLTLAQKNRDNSNALLRQNFISQNAFDNTESGLKVAEAAVESASAQLKIAQTAFNDTVIKAPMSGIIAKRHVQRGDKAAVDAPMVMLVDLSTMQLEAPVPATEIPNVQIGQAVEIRVDGFDKRKFTGKVERINPVAEAGSRSIVAYIRIANPRAELRGGMFAQGEITLERAQSALAVPIPAVLKDGERSYVYLIDAGKVLKQAVETGAASEGEGFVEIKSGLNQGARVIATRLDGLKHGAPATVKESIAKPDPAVKQASKPAG